jgi:hypothetical protein
VKLVIVVLVKLDAAVSTVPHADVTFTAPLVAPAGTVTVIWLSLSTENVVAEMLLKLTAVAPVKPVPVITTLAPADPHSGLKLAIDDTVKLAPVNTVPQADVTVTNPVVVVAGTVAVICVGLFTVNAAVTPLNLTADALVNPTPVITTL